MVPFYEDLQKMSFQEILRSYLCSFGQQSCENPIENLPCRRVVGGADISWTNESVELVLKPWCAKQPSFSSCHIVCVFNYFMLHCSHVQCPSFLFCQCMVLAVHVWDAVRLPSESRSARRSLQLALASKSLHCQVCPQKVCSLCFWLSLRAFQVSASSAVHFLSILTCTVNPSLHCWTLSCSAMHQQQQSHNDTWPLSLSQALTWTSYLACSFFCLPALFLGTSSTLLWN